MRAERIRNSRHIITDWQCVLLCARAEALVAKAHTICPYSKANRGKIDVKLLANGKAVERLRFAVWLADEAPHGLTGKFLRSRQEIPW